MVEFVAVGGVECLWKVCHRDASSAPQININYSRTVFLCVLFDSGVDWFLPMTCSSFSSTSSMMTTSTVVLGHCCCWLLLLLLLMDLVENLFFVVETMLLR
jgi:hypothetical protein